jgi:hypothetical protein
MDFVFFFGVGLYLSARAACSRIAASGDSLSNISILISIFVSSPNISVFISIFASFPHFFERARM